MLHSPGVTPGAVQITHRPRQHCVLVLCVATAHALHWYYDARQPTDLHRLVAALDAAVRAA
jgi:hypothetical protein